jgi:hypothetical protein
MRERLNSDPKAQVALVALLLVAAAFLLITRTGGGGEEEGSTATTEATVAVAGTGVTATATGATPGEAVEAAVEEAAAHSSPTTAAPPAELSQIEAPRPPRPVLDAYRANKTVVLLVVHDGGIDDAFTALASTALIRDPDVALFVVPASKLYRYAAITLGLEVSSVPALIVMRPRGLSKGTPQATVSYGLQTSQDILQAVRDASYDGPGATYHPG